ncbi:hypothetical protein EIA16_24740, partial [Escherichia coli]
EWVHVQLHQQKGMISLSPPTICNSAPRRALTGSQGMPAGSSRGRLREGAESYAKALASDILR